MNKIIILIFCLIFIFKISSIDLYSCSVSVSEYIMDNHEPDIYGLIYFHQEQEFSKNLIQKHKKLKISLKNANIFFNEVRISNINNKNIKDLYNKLPKQDPPFYVLFNNYHFYIILSPDKDLINLAESPLRKKIIKKLTKLKELEKRILGIILYLKSGDPVKDKNGLKNIKESLKNDETVDYVPVYELSRDNKDEEYFIKLLLKVDDNLDDIHEPMAFGVFGRFRVLEPLVGEEIIVENIQYLLQFLNADCSCLIKENLPGVDLLHINIWPEIGYTY